MPELQSLPMIIRKHEKGALILKNPVHFLRPGKFQRFRASVYFILALILFSGWYLMHLFKEDYSRSVLFEVHALAAIFFFAFVILDAIISTSERKAKKELHRLNQRLETMLSSIRDIIIEMDTNKIYTWANQAGLEFFGEDVIGKEASSYFVGEQETYRSIQPIFDGKDGVIYFESRQRRKDGEQRLLAWWCQALKDEHGIVKGALSSARDITEQRQAEEALRESEEKYRTLVDNASEAILVVQDGMLKYVNRHLIDIMDGYTAEELTSAHFSTFLHPDDRDMVVGNYLRRIKGEPLPPRYSFRVVTHNGTPRCMEISAVRIDWQGRPATLNFLTDITERKHAEIDKKKLEAQLLQARKMESIGRLAGGLAHDFNNILSVINGFSELAMEKIDPANPVQDDLNEIRNAGKRSANLVQQLLAFSRKQTIEPRILDFNDTVSGMLKMLGQLIGENITLIWKPAANLWPVMMDPVQIDQMFVNMVVNSRDAISGTGRITIEAENIVIDDEFCKLHEYFVPGSYVKLVFSDNGCGMDKETRDNIFEPFFTTKLKGKGTGLGLATVYGIVKQNNGFIHVDSEPDMGTTFTIYLPRAASGVTLTEEIPEYSEAPTGKETVLLVEDEEALLQLNKIFLEQLGYNVLEAGGPTDALQLAAEYEDYIHVLATDVVMPDMSGDELLERILLIRPEIRCLFMSGYTDDVITHQGIIDKDVHFLQKPFSKSALARKIRETLDE